MSNRKGRRRPARSAHSHDSESFAAILTAAKEGTATAFDDLYYLLAGRLLSFARSRRADDPEGLVSDVFLRVFRKIDSFEGSEPQFNAWVFTIARNQLIDEARRRQRRPHESPDSDPNEHERAPVDVEHEVLENLATEQLLAQLDVLTADQRDVVLLRIVADLTIDTIAQTLNKAPGAVKALQRRAFHKLADELQSDSPYPYS